MPFISESIYKNLTKDESVHLAELAQISKELSEKDTELIAEMQKAREIVEKAHSIRKEKGLAVRQPLSQLLISNFAIFKRGWETY